MSAPVLPTDAKARKNAPIARGVIDYFPRALAAVAELSRIGNEQHNPGQPMHWDKTKSTDHADCIVRHLIDRGTIDTDGVRHAAKVAWRALALLEIELEGAEPAPAEPSKVCFEPGHLITAAGCITCAKGTANAQCPHRYVRWDEHGVCFCDVCRIKLPEYDRPVGKACAHPPAARVSMSRKADKCTKCGAVVAITGMPAG